MPRAWRQFTAVLAPNPSSDVIVAAESRVQNLQRSIAKYTASLQSYAASTAQLHRDMAAACPDDSELRAMLQQIAAPAEEAAGGGALTTGGVRDAAASGLCEHTAGELCNLVSKCSAALSVEVQAQLARLAANLRERSMLAREVAHYEEKLAGLQAKRGTALDYLQSTGIKLQTARDALARMSTHVDGQLSRLPQLLEGQLAPLLLVMLRGESAWLSDGAAGLNAVVGRHTGGPTPLQLAQHAQAAAATYGGVSTGAADISGGGDGGGGPDILPLAGSHLRRRSLPVEAQQFQQLAPYIAGAPQGEGAAGVLGAPPLIPLTSSGGIGEGVGVAGRQPLLHTQQHIVQPMASGGVVGPVAAGGTAVATPFAINVAHAPQQQQQQQALAAMHSQQEPIMPQLQPAMQQAQPVLHLAHQPSIVAQAGSGIDTVSLEESARAEQLAQMRRVGILQHLLPTAPAATGFNQQYQQQQVAQYQRPQQPVAGAGVSGGDIDIVKPPPGMMLVSVAPFFHHHQYDTGAASTGVVETMTRTGDTDAILASGPPLSTVDEQLDCSLVTALPGEADALRSVRVLQHTTQHVSAAEGQALLHPQQQQQQQGRVATGPQFAPMEQGTPPLLHAQRQPRLTLPVTGSSPVAPPIAGESNLIGIPHATHQHLPPVTALDEAEAELKRALAATEDTSRTGGGASGHSAFGEAAALRRHGRGASGGGGVVTRPQRFVQTGPSTVTVSSASGPVTTILSRIRQQQQEKEQQLMLRSSSTPLEGQLAVPEGGAPGPDWYRWHRLHHARLVEMQTAQERAARGEGYQAVPAPSAGMQSRQQRGRWTGQSTDERGVGRGEGYQPVPAPSAALTGAHDLRLGTGAGIYSGKRDGLLPDERFVYGGDRSDGALPPLGLPGAGVEKLPWHSAAALAARGDRRGAERLITADATTSDRDNAYLAPDAQVFEQRWPAGAGWPTDEELERGYDSGRAPEPMPQQLQRDKPVEMLTATGAPAKEVAASGGLPSAIIGAVGSALATAAGALQRMLPGNGGEGKATGTDVAPASSTATGLADGSTRFAFRFPAAPTGTDASAVLTLARIATPLISSPTAAFPRGLQLNTGDLVIAHVPLAAADAGAVGASGSDASASQPAESGAVAKLASTAKAAATGLLHATGITGGGSSASTGYWPDDDTAARAWTSLSVTRPDAPVRIFSHDGAALCPLSMLQRIPNPCTLAGDGSGSGIVFMLGEALATTDSGLDGDDTAPAAVRGVTSKGEHYTLLLASADVAALRDSRSTTGNNTQALHALRNTARTACRRAWVLALLAAPGSGIGAAGHATTDGIGGLPACATAATAPVAAFIPTRSLKVARIEPYMWPYGALPGTEDGALPLAIEAEVRDSQQQRGWRPQEQAGGSAGVVAVGRLPPQQHQPVGPFKLLPAPTAADMIGQEQATGSLPTGVQRQKHEQMHAADQSRTLHAQKLQPQLYQQQGEMAGGADSRVPPMGWEQATGSMPTGIAQRQRQQQ